VTEPDADQSAGLSLVGTLLDERYQVEALLGAGGMGAVYRARHVHMQKVVALKVLHRETSERAEVVSRFEREAIAAGRIAHPNVAGATDFGRLADGSFYLVLEYVAGKSLGQLLEEERRLPLARALAITEQIVSALQAAHQADIVHRDLKPDNVMLLEPGARNTVADTDVVKVLDFGLAKVQQKDTDATQLTMIGAIYGTPQYMSPEQAGGLEVDGRGDLYAVGLMLYEMLAGTPPFVSDQLMPLLIKHMTEEPPPLPAEVPRSVRKIVSKLLEKKPEDRFQTADELLAALRAVSQELAEGRRSVARLPSMAGLPGVPRVMDTFEDLSTSARKASRPLLSLLSRELKKPLTFRGRTFPRWMPLGGAALLVLGVGVTTTVLGGKEPEPELQGAAASETSTSNNDDDESSPRRPTANLDPALRQVLEAAKAGSDSALYALEQRSNDDRSVDEWLALSQAHLMRKQVDKALAAFAAAIEGDELAREDKALLGALRHLADDTSHSERILRFAADHLGTIGADFLFDVWSKTSAKTEATTRAFELLSTRGVKKNLSPALALALELREAESCEQYAKLLPRVEQVGDERVLTRLRDLRKDRGCGASGRDDCYPCLRGGGLLDAAYGQAAMRKAPRFSLLRRWRWKK
jgi:serine/threonine-protein kinase